MKDRVFKKQYNHFKWVADKIFEKVFDSMQLLNYTALADAFDFEKDDMKKYNASLTDYNNVCVADKEVFYAEERRLKEEFDFDCERSAEEFPDRAKIRMIGRKFSNKFPRDIAMQGATDSINVCLVLFAHELVVNWGMGEDDLKAYWEEMKKNARCYADGMTDEFALDYFKDYFDLTITM